MRQGSHRILIGDVMARLAELPDGSVHCVVTSPPYWGLRDYSVEGQIGLEPSPTAYVRKLVTVFGEVRRVLRDDGTLWLNLGDSYNAHPNQRKTTDKAGPKQTSDAGSIGAPSRYTASCKPKDLCGIPWRVAFALQQDGWYLGCDIIWSKPNPMPESVTDRPTKAHEYVFLLAKRPRYFYDADAVREADSGQDHNHRNVLEGQPSLAPPGQTPHRGLRTVEGRNGAGRNLRSVWQIPTEAFPAAHFATFPQKLVEPCIKAGTSEKGCCPECGTPWVRVTEDQGYRKHRPSAGDDPRSRNEDKQAKGSLGGHHGWQGNNLLKNAPRTLGWRPECECQRYVDDATDPAGAMAEVLGEAWRKPIPCTVLDPFAGSGTTLLVANRLGRDAIGIELNPEYAQMAEDRIGKGLRPSTYVPDQIVDSPLFEVCMDKPADYEDTA